MSKVIWTGFKCDICNPVEGSWMPCDHIHEALDNQRNELAALRAELDKYKTFYDEHVGDALEAMDLRAERDRLKRVDKAAENAVYCASGKHDDRPCVSCWENLQKAVNMPARLEAHQCARTALGGENG